MPNLPRYYSMECLESKILKIENSNLYVKRLEFEDLKIEMFEFGFVNTKS
jgi:hypothetical protein